MPLFFVEGLENRRLLATVPTGFLDQAWGGNFSQGTQMDFAPDGRLFVLSQTGIVRVIDQSGNLLPTPAATITVDSFFERGLLGIAFDPSFDASQPGDDYVYLYYTVPAAQGGPYNNISRFVVNGDTIDLGTRTEIWRFDQLSAGNHNGGGLHFGPDGMLYAAHGENAVSTNAQSVNNMLGKIIRINPALYTPGNPEAMIPADNPASFIVRQGGVDVTATPTGVNRAIWALGLRNPFTFNWVPNGQMFINDVGQSTREEIDIGQAGANYGWPTTEGDFTQASFPNFTRPIYNYGRTVGSTIVGGVYYSTDAPLQFPATYQKRYFFGDYGSNIISYIDPANPPALNGQSPFGTSATDIVDMKLGADGAIYYLLGGASGNGVRRVRVDPAQAPSISDQPDDQSVPEGATAMFEVTAAGAGISYQWTRNGVDIPGETASSYSLSNAQLSDAGAVFRVKVLNQFGIALSQPATLQVTDGTPPQVNSSQFTFANTPPAAAHQVRLVFSENVSASLSVADLTVTRVDDNTTIAASDMALDYRLQGNQATYTFPGLPGGVLPDGNYQAVLAGAGVTDAAGNAMSANVTVDFFVFSGDADHDRTVNISDFSLLASNFNLPGTFSQGDFNYTGTVEIGDFSILASKFNTVLSSARPAAGNPRATPATSLDRADLLPQPERVFSSILVDETRTAMIA